MKTFNRDSRPPSRSGGSGYGGSSRDGGSSRFKNQGGDSRREFSRPGGKSFGAKSFDRPSTMYKATCADCGKACEVPFRPTGEKPVLCSFCYADKSGGNRATGFAREKTYDKKLFKATCVTCGKDCEVPFRPIEGKDVFCADCFESDPGTASKKNFGTNNQEQFDAINAKLDQILKALSMDSVRTETPKKPLSAQKAAKKATKPLKSKRVAKK